METSNNVNVQKKMMMGTYSSKTMLIDPCDGMITNQLNSAEAFAKGDQVELGGEALPTLNKDFFSQEQGKDYSYISFQLASNGTTVPIFVFSITALSMEIAGHLLNTSPFNL